MPAKFKITIDKPCLEQWGEMSINNDGRFCNTCQNSVTDFTHFSNQDLQEWFAKNQGSGCGRFNPGQLDRMIVAKPKFSLKRLKPGLIAASLVAVLTLPKSLHARTLATYSMNSFKKASVLNQKTSEDSSDASALIVKGNVIADDNNLPIPGAVIKVKGSKLKAISDDKGNFEFKLKPEDYRKDLVLQVSYIGYEGKEVRVKPKQSKLIFVKMKMDQSVLGGFGLILQKSFFEKVRDMLSV